MDEVSVGRDAEVEAKTARLADGAVRRAELRAEPRRKADMGEVGG